MLLLLTRDQTDCVCLRGIMKVRSLFTCCATQRQQTHECKLYRNVKIDFSALGHVHRAPTVQLLLRFDRLVKFF